MELKAKLSQAREEYEAAVAAALEECRKARALAFLRYDEALDAAYRDHTLNKQTLAGAGWQDAINKARANYAYVEALADEVMRQKLGAAERIFLSKKMAAYNEAR